MYKLSVPASLLPRNDEDPERISSVQNFQRLIPSCKNKLTAVKKARRNTAPPVVRNNTKKDLRPSTANN